jgi:hypothetical protein
VFIEPAHFGDVKLEEKNAKALVELEDEGGGTDA